MIKVEKHYSHLDSRGSLTPIEFSDIPFIPKRCFYVSDVPVGTIRGSHSHKETEQYLICMSGQIEVQLDDGKQINTCILDKNHGCFVDKNIWDSQVFKTSDAVLLVLCSTSYYEQDYILDYNEFKRNI